MGKSQQEKPLKIHLDNSRGIAIAGEDVTGFISIETTSQSDVCSSLIITLLGSGYTTLQPSALAQASCFSMYGRKLHVTHAHKSTALINTNMQPVPLRQGTVYKFPFSISLPSTLPSSIDVSPRAETSYFLECNSKGDNSRLPAKVARRPLVVIGRCSLTHGLSAAYPIKVLGDPSLGATLMSPVSKGTLIPSASLASSNLASAGTGMKVYLALSLSAQGFLAGDVVPFHAVVQNLGKRSVGSVSVLLIQLVTILTQEAERERGRRRNSWLSPAACGETEASLVGLADKKMGVSLKRGESMRWKGELRLGDPLPTSTSWEDNTSVIVKYEVVLIAIPETEMTLTSTQIFEESDHGYNSLIDQTSSFHVPSVSTEITVCSHEPITGRISPAATIARRAAKQEVTIFAPGIVIEEEPKVEEGGVKRSALAQTAANMAAMTQAADTATVVMSAIAGIQLPPSPNVNRRSPNVRRRNPDPSDAYRTPNVSGLNESEAQTKNVRFSAGDSQSDIIEGSSEKGSSSPTTLTGCGQRTQTISPELGTSTQC